MNRPTSACLAALAALLLAVVFVTPVAARGGSEKPEITVSWCNFTDTGVSRTLQGPTGGSTSISMGFSEGVPDEAIPELDATDVQRRLEETLGIRFQAMGAPESTLLIKLVQIFGTPGARRPPDAGPPAAVDREPDVFPYGYWCTGWPHDEKFIQSVCAGLTEEEVRTWMPGMARAIRSVAPSFGGEAAVWDFLKVAGKIVSLPLNIEESFGETVDTPAGVLWRADVLRELGMSVPATIEQWDQAFEVHHRRYPNKVVWRDDRNFFSWRSVYTATGVPYGNWIASEGRATPWWTQPEIRRALAVLQSWYQKGYLNTVQPERPDPEAFVAGESIVADLVEWEYGNWVVSEPYVPGSLPYRTRELDPGASFALAPPPRFEDVAALRLPLARRNVLWGQFAFAKRLENERDKLHRIMAVIDRIASDRDTFLLAYHGIEGRDWVWSREGATDSVRPLLDDVQRQKVGLGRFWTHALYGSSLPYRMDRRVLESRAALTSGTGALYGSQVNVWHQDPLRRLQVSDAETHQRLYEKQMELYQEFERVETRIVRRGEPLRLFDEYLLWYRDHGGPEMEAEISRLVDWSAQK